MKANYIVQVTVYSYSNPRDFCATCTPTGGGQGCCDNPSCSGTGDTCDTTFFYCLRSLSAPQPFMGSSYCSPVNPGIRTISSQMDSNNVDFSQDMVLGLSNPLPIGGIANSYMVWSIDIILICHKSLFVWSSPSLINPSNKDISLLKKKTLCYVLQSTSNV